MSAALDKSLDEIIGSRKKPARARITNTRRAAGPRRVAKNAVAGRRVALTQRNVRARVQRAAAPVNAAQRVAALLQNTKEARVNVEGLPREIKQDAVREFFSSEVGGVQRVLLSYNERGNSTGMATITFRNGEMAKRAVAKFNGAPIDGGRSRLKLNLIIDPTAQPVRTLNERITALPRGVPSQRGQQRPHQRGQQRPQQRGQQKPQQRGQQRAPSRKAAAAKAEKQKRREKPVKKSLEELDKEMADYFEEKK
ncbi:hypothetical protein TPHA_0E01590 [Tetrapisispora phaffii CBS 4417]|uniref:RRM domain-containing protein n=1 Tax=Tetrapisispora phaffii (strain ATCC 24235 / CBS 4417 / NBRC 1672 / NRRL Y-8282 / UCD 70-5) TaxID=1071381 RepID=G8BTM4_TETPH|nr:hypothetical protein TPHA_0E01590 [Tetrapisispora phaffii CBS 4417]CCE63252.1 hypothetical protein TPHA_0E01590 [Tetrapisispora phaffii CBS 4417]